MMFTVRNIKDEKDIHQVSDLISKVYNFMDYYEHYDNVFTRYSHHPDYKFSNALVCEINNEIVGHLRIVPQILKVGSSYIKSGGFAAICVKTTLRKKGIARSLIETALEKLKKEDYDICLLFGIPDFYQRFGFVPAFKEFQTLVNVRGLKELENNNYKIKNFPERYSLNLWKIYHRYLSNFSFFPIRPLDLWKYRKEFLKSLKIIFSKNKPCGYFNLNFEEDSIVITELMSKPDMVIYQTILNYLRKEALRSGKKQVKIFLPGIHPFLSYLKGKNILYQIKYEKNSFALAKVLNWESLFSKLIPEFSKNLNNSPYYNLKELNISVGGKIYTLNFKNKKLVEPKDSNLTVKLTPDLLTQLVFGYQDAYSLCFRHKIKLSKGKINILNFLFPPLETLMFPVDRF